MQEYIDYFLNYLQTEKDASPNTVHKYLMNNYGKLKII